MKIQPWYITPRESYSNKSAFIIGGGISGTSAAYSLAIRGWQVTLIERSKNLADGASGNQVGIISPLLSQKNDPIGQFYWKAFEYIANRLKNLNIFEQCGILDLSKANKNLSEMVGSEHDIIKLSPEIASSFCGMELKNSALHIAKGGFVSPAQLCNTNIIAGGKRIRVILSHNVLSLIQNEFGWVAIDGVGKEIASAPVCIIANAADASDFLQSNFIPLHKVRGQLTQIRACHLNLQKILCYDGGYISPEFKGFHYIGATYSRDNMSCDANLQDNTDNISNLNKFINTGNIDISSLNGRASFRATVPDRRPVIGLLPDIKSFNSDYADLKYGRINKNYPPGKYLGGLYISTGHGSRGLVSAPIGGEIIASMLSNEDLIISQQIMNLLSPARFIIRKLQGRL